MLLELKEGRIWDYNEKKVTMYFGSKADVRCMHACMGVCVWIQQRKKVPIKKQVR
jgi:hypothetical protein